MKKLFKYLLCFIGYYILLYLLSPIFGVSNLSEYSEQFYWLKILIVEAIVLGSMMYFDINPRKHIMIHIKRTKQHFILWIVEIILLSITWITLMILIAIWIPDNSFIKIVLIILWFLLLPVLFYIFIFRGVSLYRNKKIRIFKLKVTTYKNGVIENIIINDFGENAKINIVINGQDNYFIVSKPEADAYKSMISQAIDTVKENKFYSLFDKKDD